MQWVHHSGVSASRQRRKSRREEPRSIAPRAARLLSIVVPLFSLACTPTNPVSEAKAQVAELELPAGSSRTIAREGLVSAEFIPQYGSVARTGAAQTLAVMVRLTADDLQGQLERPPLDLAIVLDRSGSMHGEKLRYAKQAGLDLLNKLEPRDHVTLISYDSDVVTHAAGLPADADNLARVRSELLQLDAGSATALGPALFEGLDVLARSFEQARLDHVILLSDGLANVGVQDPTLIAARAADGYRSGITVSSLGMGVDYNEELMTEIADQGGGRYHFIEDADHIQAVLADELAGLTTSVAGDLAVEFAATAPIRLDTVYGYVSTREAELTAIRVGYLAAGQSREIMARLEVPDAALAGAVGDTLELGWITVRFRPLVGEGQADQLVELRVPATVHLAGSSDEAKRSENSEVTVRMYELEAAAALREATAAVDRGDFDAASQIVTRQHAGFEASLGNATSEVEKQKISAEIRELETAAEQLEQAKHSQHEAKAYSKQYKASSYAKGKGSKKLRSK